jgi:hypothetical protein
MMAAAQRVAHQPPRARGNTFQNRRDLAREAVGCMRVLAGGAAISGLLDRAMLRSGEQLCNRNILVQIRPME